MNWEVYPDALYQSLKRLHDYKGIKKILVTENGAAFTDEVNNDMVHDVKRLDFIQRYIQKMLQAKQEGINVQGVFCMDIIG
jgi:beta-glucosidase